MRLWTEHQKKKKKHTTKTKKTGFTMPGAQMGLKIDHVTSAKVEKSYHPHVIVVG